jgi:hypothetical protein
MDQDDTLFGWLRYYVSFLAAFVFLGVGAASLYVGLAGNEFEAWSTVIEDGFRIQPRQVGAVAEAIFRSEAAYGPAMEALGIEGDPRSFLSTSTDIRPVPETNVVIIVGRAEDSQRAEEISAAMANSFVDAVEDRIEFSNFTVFDAARTVPVRGDVSTPVGLSVGGASAFWLAFGASVLHYRLRRPVLAVERARSIVRPTSVTPLDGSWWSWLGIFRPKLKWSDVQNNESKLALLASGKEGPAVVEAPGASDRKLKRLAKRLPKGWLLHGFHPVPADSASQEHSTAIVVADPSTNEVDLEHADFVGGEGPTSHRGRRRVELVWIR